MPEPSTPTRPEEERPEAVPQPAGDPERGIP